MVDKRGEYVFAPSLLWVMVGQRRPAQITKDVRRMLRPGVELVQAEVEEIQPERGRVPRGRAGVWPTTTWSSRSAPISHRKPCPAMPRRRTTSSPSMAPLASGKIWPGSRGAGRSVLVSALPYKCPAAPYEAAMLLDDALRRRDIRSRSQVEVFTPEMLPMPVAGPAMGEAVAQMLSAKDIRLHPKRQVQRIEPASRELVFADGQREPFDFLAAVPPHRAPAVLKGSQLVNDAGWVQVDKHTLKTRYDNVYAVGDATMITLANGKPLPKAGTFAHAEAEVVAERIAAAIHGAGTETEFDGAGYCWLESGGGSAGFTSGAVLRRTRSPRAVAAGRAGGGTGAK